LNTAGIISCFRLGYDDAAVLSRELFPPGYLRESHTEFDVIRLVGKRIPVLQERNEALKQAALVNQLTQLRPREFWTKRRGPFEPVKQRALLMPEPLANREALQARRELVAASGRRFGKLKSDVRKELENGTSHTAHSAPDTRYYEPL
jgi:hypothetical protein